VTIGLIATVLLIAGLWWGVELWRWFDLARRRRRYVLTEEDCEEEARR
jgi:hypothetical protein